ncbi:SIS domain-containing protein [Oryzifoliimicrobium ureilyticus]|uniref:SIS domain-containing protein n=1 Tax=Oryzifoliimicrobium ureilyticus TaxID=3113724 RepID=UPI0030763BA2
MNLTEKVIREQFPFWDKALAQPLPEVEGKTIIVTGCGTSFYLAQTVAAAFNHNGRNAIAVPGAEWARRMEDYLADRSDVTVIGLSRSGTTTETIQAMDASRKAGLRTIAISCEADTPILRAADVAVYLPTHKEEGIVMTVSASLMLIAGLRMAGTVLGSVDEAKAALAAAEGCVPLIRGRTHYVYLGGGALYGMATEGCLKLQEMSITYSQAFHPLEYRHGPISLIDDKSVVVILYSQDTVQEEALVAEDVRKKGAKVIGLGGPGDLEISLSQTGAARALEVLPALQIIGERVANQKGVDTAAPRHLSKVVILG